MARTGLFLIPCRDCSSMMLVHAEPSRDLECAVCRASFDPATACFGGASGASGAAEAAPESDARETDGPGARL
jgi:ribosomal protein S27E